MGGEGATGGGPRGGSADGGSPRGTEGGTSGPGAGGGNGPGAGNGGGPGGGADAAGSDPVGGDAGGGPPDDGVGRPETGKQPLARIAVLACLKDSTGGSILDQIVGHYKPQAGLWIGDAIYADTTDPTAYKSKWGVLGANPRFQALKALCPQYAVWDDHDYGVNNGGASSHPTKTQAQQIFQDFWGVPPDSPLRRQQGVYNGFTWGPQGKRVQVLLLDVRYHRTSFGVSGTMLGAAQWEWLTARLDEPAEFRLIVSGVPWIASTEDECWPLMPNEQKKLFDLIKTNKIGGVVLVSGDDHAVEVCRAVGAFGYDALDLTAAGLDRGEAANTNPSRISPRIGDSSKFGFINFDWSSDPVVTLGCYVGGKTTPAFEIKRKLSELQAT